LLHNVTQGLRLGDGLLRISVSLVVAV